MVAMVEVSELTAFPSTGRFLAGRARHAVSDAEKRRLENLVERVEERSGGERIICRGEVSGASTILIDGFMIRTLETQGERHAVSFHVPGDFVDLHCFALKRLDHNIDCVGPVRIGVVPHDNLRAAMAEDANLGRLLWFSTLLDAAMHRQWIMKLEQLTVPRRIAHIFAEIWRRLRMVGLGDEHGFDTPLTQTVLSEMCGASPIHTNRAVGRLRQEEIADFRRGRIEIPSRDAMPISTRTISTAAGSWSSTDQASGRTRRRRKG